MGVLRWPPAALHSVTLRDLCEAYDGYHRATSNAAMPVTADFLRRMQNKFPDTPPAKG